MSQRRQGHQQRQGKGSSLLHNYLIFAACYKLVRFKWDYFLYIILLFTKQNMQLILLQNTKDHFDYAMQMWNNSVQEHQLNQSANFVSMLAVNQEQPEVALDILPAFDKHFSSKIVRIIALSECGKLEEAAEHLKILLQSRNFRISEIVVGKMEFKV